MVKFSITPMITEIKMVITGEEHLLFLALWIIFISLL